MTPLDLSALGLPLLEMRCTHCQKLQYIAIRSLSADPRLTRCSHCKTLLVHQLTMKAKPNHVLLTLVVSPLPECQNEGGQPDDH